MRRTLKSRGDRRRGSTLIEFSLIALLLIMIMFTMFEMNRAVLVMTALADATRAGMRFAIVHGKDNPTTSTQIQTVIKDFAASGSLNIANLNFPTLTYNASSPPGTKIDITVTYVYDPFTRYFPLNVTLSSTSEGIITY